MTKEELDAIASRAPYCRSFGESVSLSRVERDELVALARNGMRYRGLRAALFQQWLSVGEAEIGMRVYGACPTETDIDAAIDAAAAKEEA